MTCRRAVSARGAEVPNHKSQVPNKNQIPKHKSQTFFHDSLLSIIQRIKKLTVKTYWNNFRSFEVPYSDPFLFLLLTLDNYRIHPNAL